MLTKTDLKENYGKCFLTISFNSNVDIRDNSILEVLKPFLKQESANLEQNQKKRRQEKFEYICFNIIQFGYQKIQKIIREFQKREYQWKPNEF